MNIEKAISLLISARRYMDYSGGASIVHAVYISPAEQMRRAADQMEAKDRLIREIDEFLNNEKNKIKEGIEAANFEVAESFVGGVQEDNTSEI